MRGRAIRNSHQAGIRVVCPSRLSFVEPTEHFFEALPGIKQYAGTEFYGSGRRSMYVETYDYRWPAQQALRLLLEADASEQCRIELVSADGTAQPIPTWESLESLTEFTASGYRWSDRPRDQYTARNNSRCNPSDVVATANAIFSSLQIDGPQTLAELRAKFGRLPCYNKAVTQLLTAPKTGRKIEEVMNEEGVLVLRPYEGDEFHKNPRRRRSRPNPSVEEMQEQYKTVRFSTICYDVDFDKEIKRRAAAVREMSGELDPRAWLSLAHEIHKEAKQTWSQDRSTERCGRCAGTGQFITMMVNGKPVGPGGICFRCRGKGVEDRHDRRRNCYYDRFGIRV